MKKYIINAAVGLAALTSFTACGLDEYNPTQVTADETLSTPAGIYGMEALCYKPIYAELYSVFDFMSMAECGTDTWWSSNDETYAEQMFYYEGLTVETNKGWDKSFRQMYSALGICNTVITSGEKLTDDQTKILVAEAHFLRAYYHLMLTTYYGPITLVTKGVPTENVVYSPKRNTLSEIYSLIIEDLNYAVANLPLTPYEGNRARATRKSAMGMLCRAYIQGAGQGLSENGVSYWQRAKEVSENFIANQASYGASMYDDISDTWADTNNRSNKEALFTAAGQDATDNTDLYNNSSSFSNKLFAYCYTNQKDLEELSLIKDDDAQRDSLYGRCNESRLAPSEYLLHCFNPSWDRRWENSFQTAYFGYSQHLTGYKKWGTARVKWAATGDLSKREAAYTSYNMDASVNGKRIAPYVELGSVSYAAGGIQHPAKVWKKGLTTIKGISDTYTQAQFEADFLETAKKIYVVDYPLAQDDNRFYLYLYPEWDDVYKGQAFDKTNRVYVSIPIEHLFTTRNGYRSYVYDQDEFKQNEQGIMLDKAATLYKARPSLNKFIWNFEGVYSSNMQVRNGDIAIMRMAEVYLIAAEASQHLGDNATAAKYINVLRKRALRPSYTGSYEISASEVTEDEIFDEYARELCGEFQRWALLQRHQAFKTRLPKYNGRAALSYKDHMIWRPISATFLQQIDNKEEYGDNGYGTTAKSGLDGYLK